jgi:hypothetical protein
VLCRGDADADPAYGYAWRSDGSRGRALKRREAVKREQIRFDHRAVKESSLVTLVPVGSSVEVAGVVRSQSIDVYGPARIPSSTRRSAGPRPFGTTGYGFDAAGLGAHSNGGSFRNS